MSDAAKVMARFEEYAGGFLHPLMTGGAASIGRPLPPSFLDTFALARPTEPVADQETFDAMHRVAAGVAPPRVLPYPDRGAQALAMAVHNLVAVTDPKLDRTFARRTRPVMLAWVDGLVAAAGLPETRGEVLARHAVVSRAALLRRRDVVVTNWAYTYRFFGRPVPKNVVAMPKLRFVKQQKTERALLPLFEELQATTDLELSGRFRAILSRSPLTEILRLDLCARWRFGAATLAVVSDSQLSYGLARELARGGLPRDAARFGAALVDLADERPPAGALFHALAFLIDLMLVDTLDARMNRDEPFGGVADPDARLFAALLPTVLSSPGPFASRLVMSDDDTPRIARRAHRLAAVAGEDARARALSILKRAVPATAVTGPTLGEAHP